VPKYLLILPIVIFSNCFFGLMTTAETLPKNALEGSFYIRGTGAWADHNPVGFAYPCISIRRGLGKKVEGHIDGIFPFGGGQVGIKYQLLSDQGLRPAVAVGAILVAPGIIPAAFGIRQIISKKITFFSLYSGVDEIFPPDFNFYVGARLPIRPRHSLHLEFNYQYFYTFWAIYEPPQWEKCYWFSAGMNILVPWGSRD